jgi:hypothetical protein
MNTTDNFSKRFLTVCAGLSMVLLSGAALVYTAKPSMADPKTVSNKFIQSGTSENYIPLGIANGTAYWVVYNTSDGYKFRKASISSAKWEEK